MLTSRRAAMALLALTTAGCDPPNPAEPEPRPVRVVVVDGGAAGEIISLTGQVRARDQANLAFRLDGRVTERLVRVGDVLRAGDVVARLDPQNQQNAAQAARANLSAAEAVLTQARLTFRRQQELLRDGWTPRARFDEAQQALQTAQAQVDAAQAQLRIVEDQLGYTVLTADDAGAVTTVGAEQGEVVRAGQTVVQLAREGGRDAVFDVPEQLIRTAPRDPVVQVVLTDDPRIRAMGRVREVAPQADPATRTFQVKVDIVEPPADMRLGSTVSGSIVLAAPLGVELPASALTRADGRPAVWLVDPESWTVSLRAVEVARFDPGRVVVSRGLLPGEIVVTAGTQVLRPHQRVRLMGAV